MPQHKPLYAINPLTKFLKQNKNIYPEASFGSAYQQLIKNFKPLVAPNKDLLALYVVESMHLISALSKNNPFAQEDASEFFGEIVDRLRTTGKDASQNFISNLIRIDSRTTIDCPRNHNEYFNAYEHSITDYYLTLPVKIYQKKLETVQQCLQEYSKVEILDDPDNYYYHEDEQRHIANCKKQIRLLHASTILILGLNRYSFNPKMQTAEKVSHDVTIPLQLDLKPFLIEQQEHSTYDLIAAIIHEGTGTKVGHYTAYVKHKDRWYFCDDSSITEKTAREVKKKIKTGYVYIYKQTAQPKSFLEKKLYQLKKLLMQIKQLLQ